MIQQESSLYLINIKALVPSLSVRRLHPQDLLLRLYTRSLECFKDGEERFKLVYTRPSDLEAYLKQKCDYYQQFKEENQVISQLGKSIINNSKNLILVIL